MMKTGEEYARDFNLASLFGQSSPPLLGLDISTSGVRMVELAMPARRAAAGTLRLRTAAARRRRRRQHREHGRGRRSRAPRLEKKRHPRPHVALGMPPASVITKKIILPAGLAEDQLEVQVESEASQYIPFALDEVSLDFDVIGPAANSPDDMEVMLAASRKEKVEDRVAIAEAAGLTAMVMDIESYAARAALDRVVAQMPNAGAGQIVALFQIGAQVTHISVMQDGETIYEREQPFGGNQLTQDIVRAYGMAFEEAETKQETPASCRNTTGRPARRPSWKTPRWKSRARSSSSTPRRPTPASTRSSWPAAAQDPGSGRPGRQPHADPERGGGAVPGHAAGARVRETQLRKTRPATWSPAAWRCGGSADDPH